MVVVAAVLLVVAVALGVLLVRRRARIDELTEAVARVERSRDDADGARRAAEAARAAAQRERDDALEREKRARREAADVGRRLHEEHVARGAADDARAEAEAEVARLRASAEDGRGDAELWSLAVAAVRRTWEVSVAPSPGLASPLEGAVDELRTAIEIEVDAAREEAGAAIDLDWDGDVVQSPAVAVRVLSIVQALVARLAKTSEDAVLRVTSGVDAVVIEVEGTDEAGRSVVPVDVAAEHQVAPGRYVLRAQKA